MRRHDSLVFDHACQDVFNGICYILDQEEWDYDLTQESLLIRDQRGVYLFNVHPTLQEFWLSSPCTGGHHFFYDPQNKTETEFLSPSSLLPLHLWFHTRDHQTLFHHLKREWGTIKMFSHSLSS